MRILRPVWLTHGGEKKDVEVYSCHVSPDGKRLATAAGDSHVRVWSTEAVYNAADAGFNGPKQLASMSHHLGTIHAVRFSSDGKYLASGADDRLVCVYNLDPNPPSHAATFGTDEPPPVENWRVFRRLIGHDNDVQDLGWSHDSSILVSVGLDSKVVVWSGYTFEKLKTISSHQSLVKGITFDPANKYFATASDDRSIKIFRFAPPGPNSTAHDQSNNFVLEKTITTPFAGSPLTAYFRRCSFSPDGNHIAAANAVNGPVSTVAIINRGSWDGDIHLIGHEGPVEVCAFSPRLFTKEPWDPSQMLPGQPISHTVTVIACAGQDKALTIWITSNAHPMTIIQDLGEKSITDLAWSPDGYTLFATSLDGTISVVRFTESEIGHAVPLEQNEKSLAKFGGGRKGAGLVEGPTALILEEKSKEGELRGVEGRMGALMGDALPTLAPPTNGTAAASESNGQAASGNAGSAAAPDPQKPEINPGSNGAAPQHPPNGDSQAARIERIKQRVTITKDGKKRVAPLLVSNSAIEESLLPRPQLMAASTNGQGSSVPQTVLDLSKPFDGLPKGGIATLLLGNKRKLAEVDGDDDGHQEKRLALAGRGGAVPILSNTPDGLAVPRAPVSATEQPFVPDFIRPAVTNPSLTVSHVRLAVPKLRARVFQAHGRDLGVNAEAPPDDSQPPRPGSTEADPEQSEVMFEAHNPTGPAPTRRPEDREPARISLSKRGVPIWQDYLPRSVLLMTGGDDFWVAACEDGSVYAWTPNGRRLINAMVLESQPVLLESSHNHLLCITAVGLCYVWNMHDLASPHPPVSLAPILDIAVANLQNQPTKAPAITSARLNSEGRIVISLSNGDGYAYSPVMYTWQRLSEVWWAVGSQFWNTADSSVGNLNTNRDGDEQTRSIVSAGIVPYLERQTTNEMLARGRAYFLQKLVKTLISREGYENFESSVSTAHLENRLAGALMLGAKDEFRAYLRMYAKKLGGEGARSKVEELLRTLLGDGLYEVTEHDDGAGEEGTRPVNVGRNWEGATPMLCGWPRRGLLKDVVLILGKYRELQRITLPYFKLLGLTNEHPGQEDHMEA